MALFEVFRNASDSLIHDINQNLFHIDVADELLKHSFIQKSTADLLMNFEIEDDVKTRTLVSELALLPERMQTTTGVNDEAGNVNKLYECLQRTGYSHLITICKRYTDEFDRINELFDAGRVPAPPTALVDRPKLTHQIRTAICSSCSTSSKCSGARSSWILVRGMAGTGKSVAVSVAVRDAAFAVKCFHRGVFWLSFSRLQSGLMDVELNKRLLLLYRYVSNSLSLGTGTVSYEAQDRDEVIIRLRELFSKHKFVRDSILVLDDVWDEKVLEVFGQIACKCVIVTTRQRQFRSVPDDNNTTVIEINEGFTVDQSLQLFSTVLRCSNIDALPREAKQIHEECCGSPLAISLIASILKERPDWSGVLHELRESQLTRLCRRRSGPVDAPDTDSSSFLLTKAISMSVDSLSAEDRQRFLRFAAFNDDVPIPADALSIIWSMPSREDVCRKMQVYVNSSLCHEEYSTKIRQSVYWLHDLILDYLKDQARTEHAGEGDEVLMQYHRDIVEAYRTKCQGSWYNLPYDYYAHRFLYWHMIEAGMYADVTNLYTNLNFLTRKVSRNGVGSVLLDYSIICKKYRQSNARRRGRSSSNVSSQKCSVPEFQHLQAFERFFLNYKNLIHSSGSNLLQLGLLQPRSSLVYAAAVKSYEALQHDLNNKFSYKISNQYLFSWLNQPQRSGADDGDAVSARIFLSHPIQCGAFLRRDLHAFVVADTRGVIQHYDMRTLKRLTGKLKLSEASVNAVQVLRNGDKILLASDDGYIRLTRLGAVVPRKQPASSMRQQSQRSQSSSSLQQKSQRSGGGHGDASRSDADEYKLKRAHYLSVSDSEGDESDSDDVASIAESNSGSVITYNGGIDDDRGSSDGEAPTLPPQQYDGHLRRQKRSISSFEHEMDQIRITALAVGVSGKRCVSGDSLGGLHYWQIDEQKTVCSTEIAADNNSREEIVSVALGAVEDWAVTASLLPPTQTHAKQNHVVFRLWQVSTSALVECWRSVNNVNANVATMLRQCVVACRTPEFKNVFLTTAGDSSVAEFRVERSLKEARGEKHFAVRAARKFLVAADGAEANATAVRNWPIEAICLTNQDLYLAVAVGHFIFVYDFANSCQKAENNDVYNILCILRGPTSRITSLSAAHVQQELLATCRNGSAFVFNVAHSVGTNFDTPVRHAAVVATIESGDDAKAMKSSDMEQFVVHGGRNNNNGGVIYDSDSYDVCFIHHREMSDNTIIDNNDAATMPTGVLVLSSDCVKQNLRYVALTLYRFDNDAEAAGENGSFLLTSEPPVRNKLQVFLRLPQPVNVMKICPDAQLLVFGMHDGTLRFVRLNKSVIMQKNVERADIVEKFCDIKHHEGRVRTIQFHYGYAVTTGEDFSVRFWALNGIAMLNLSPSCAASGSTWPPVHVMCFVAHSSPVVSLVLPQPSHALVYVAANAGGGKKAANIDEQRFKIVAVQSNSAATLTAPVAADKFVSVGDDGVIKLCSLRMAHSLLAAGSLMSSSPATRTPTDHAWCMSNDSKYLLGCSNDGRAQIWDIEAALIAENQPLPTTTVELDTTPVGSSAATLVNHGGNKTSSTFNNNGAGLDETPVAVCQAFCSSATTCGIFVPVTRTRLNIVGGGNSFESTSSSSSAAHDDNAESSTAANAIRRSSLPTLAVDANASPDFFSSLVVLGSQDGELVFWNWQSSDVPLFRHRVSRAPILQIAHFAMYERSADDNDVMPINLILVLSDALYVYQVPEWIANATEDRNFTTESGEQYSKFSSQEEGSEIVDSGVDDIGAERKGSLHSLQVFPLIGRGARKFFVQSARKMIVVADDVGYLYILKPEF